MTDLSHADTAAPAQAAGFNAAEAAKRLVPPPREGLPAASSASEDQLGTIVAAVRTWPNALGLDQRPHRTHGIQYRFTCPVCTTPASAVTYAGRRRAVLYCDRKCTIGQLIRALRLDWEAVTGAPDPVDGKPTNLVRIDITNEVDAIRSMRDAVCAGVFPRVFERSGALVQVVETVNGEDDAGGPVVAIGVDDVGEHQMRALLVDHSVTFRETRDGRRLALPTAATCRTLLAFTSWPGVQPLVGVVRTPVVRPDGSVLQNPGYDDATGLYLAATVDVPQVPDKPAPREVEAAKHLLLNKMLTDFPWVEDADRANYLGLLLTPLLRPYARCLAPLGVITAPERGSGKSLLSDLLRYIFGAEVRPWPATDEEMRKGITGVLRETAPVVVYDNIPATAVVDHPSFASLLTNAEWTDRVLGASQNITLRNDRMWLINGTNVRLGGDMGQRSVLIRLDAQRPRPDLRDQFVIPDLTGWIQAHRGRVLHALLILIRDWTAAGAPAQNVPMRGYTPWASAIGGLLSHHGIAGWLANRRKIETHDEDAEVWTAFLDAWWHRYAGRRMRLRDLIPDDSGYPPADPAWLDAFPRVRGGALPTAKALGALLRERDRRFYGDYAVRVGFADDGKSPRWWLMQYQGPPVT